METKNLHKRTGGLLEQDVFVIFVAVLAGERVVKL